MNDVVLVAIIAALPGTLTALAAFKQSRRNGTQLEDLNIKVDGRLTELLASTRLSERAAGVADERQVGADRAVLVAKQAATDISAAEARMPGSEVNP